MNFYMTPAMDIGELKTGIAPAYTTDESYLLFNMIGGFYLTGHITRSKFKKVCNGLPVHDEPFRSSHKIIMKRQQLEQIAIQFDNTQIDHFEMCSIACDVLDIDPQGMCARVGDTFIIFDSPEKANEFADDFEKECVA